QHRRIELRPRPDDGLHVAHEHRGPGGERFHAVTPAAARARWPTCWKYASSSVDVSILTARIAPGASSKSRGAKADASSTEMCTTPSANVTSPAPGHARTAASCASVGSSHV